MNTTIISFLCCLLFVGAALAGDSFNLSSIRDLLQQQSRRWEEIRKEYDIEETGDALRFGRQWEHLGGARCGPYELKARKKGSSGAYTHTITIKTQATFYDKQGKEVTDSVDDAPFDSYRVKEIVKSIDVSPDFRFTRVAAVEGAATNARTSPTTLLVSSPETNPATAGSERFVIKGLRLGAGPSTVLEFLKANSFAPSEPPHQRSIAGKTSIQTISYVDSQEYRNRKTGLAEAILTLEFTPPFPGSSGVVSVVHSIQYSTKYGEGLSKEQVLADLQTKYGKPDSISPKSNDALAPTWTVAGTNYDCNLQATIIPPANAGEPGELQLWAFDKPLYWRAEKMAKEHIDRVDAQRPKDTTKPDF